MADFRDVGVTLWAAEERRKKKKKKKKKKRDDDEVREWEGDLVRRGMSCERVLGNMPWVKPLNQTR